MKELPPDDELLTLLYELNRSGGAVDYVLIDPEAHDCSSLSLHQEAAIFGLRALESRWKSQGPAPDPCFTYKIGPVGIRLQNWFGFRKKIKPTLRASDYFEPADELTYQIEKLCGAEIDLKQFMNAGPSQGAVKGYKRAFCDPPYPLRLPPFLDKEMSPHQIEELFQKTNEKLFGDLKKVVRFYCWSTDWCSYFDLGHEWWGAFLWTVQRDEKAPIVWIGASASD